MSPDETLEAMHEIVLADSKIPFGLRNDFHWRMSAESARAIARAFGFPLVDGESLAGLTMLGRPVEITGPTGDEVLLVLKVR